MSIGTLPFTLDQSAIDQRLFRALEQYCRHTNNPTVDEILELSHEILCEIWVCGDLEDHERPDTQLKIDVLALWIDARKCGG